jgi:class 3 adenylate cyclase
VLFLAANPRCSPGLRLDEEIREISAKIRGSKYRDSLKLRSRWAVRPDDLQQALLEEQPDILHFSGHGSQEEEIILEANDGTPKPVSTAGLSSLFRILKDRIRVVVLNDCYSHAQAEAITRVIDCAVGMRKAVGDRAAIKFAASFYRALGFGRSIQEAFDLGRTALLLEGIPEQDTPQLLVRTGVDPAAIVLVQAPQRGASSVIAVPTAHGSETQAEGVEKAIVVVDLSRYSDIAKDLEQQLGARAVRDLNTQIQGFITRALETAGVVVNELPYKNTGDGAIVALETSEKASRFAETLHEAAQAHNLKKDPSAQRHFRVGIWTDTVILDRQETAGGHFVGFEMAGTAIANAVRLEGACRTGEVLISPDTWGDLPKAMRKLYGDQVEVKGKRGERFRAHRRKVVDPAPWDPNAPSPNPVPEPHEEAAMRPAVKPTTPVDRTELLIALYDLSPTDLAKLVTTLPGASAQVTKNAPVPDQVAELIRWAESSSGPGLVHLYDVATRVLPNFR